VVEPKLADKEWERQARERKFAKLEAEKAKLADMKPEVLSQSDSVDSINVPLCFLALGQVFIRSSSGFYSSGLH